MFDLFGPAHSRYARRNAHNTLKGELEATSGAEQSKATFVTDNLAAVLKRRERKADSDIGRNVLDLLPAGFVRITKVECRGGACTVRKRGA